VTGDPFPLVPIEHGDLRAVFAPTLGGRMLSLRIGDEELLWQNPALVDDDLRPMAPVETWPRGDGGMGTWANVGGSKTWPAPQGWAGPDEWAGPPDPVLDAGGWEVVAQSRTSVTLRSAADRRTGLRFERTFTLGGGGLVDEWITMTNVGDRTTHWAPWEVCQVRTDDGGTVFIEDATAADELDLGSWEGTLTSAATGRGIELPVSTGVAKRGYRAGTAVGYRRTSGTTIRLAAAAEHAASDAPFPDGGSRFEVWSQRPVAEPIVALDGLRPDAHLVELEVLGGRVPLAPGATRTIRIAWSVTRWEGA
jgi:hypothetical protein